MRIQSFIPVLALSVCVVAEHYVPIIARSTYDALSPSRGLSIAHRRHHARLEARELALEERHETEDCEDEEPEPTEDDCEEEASEPEEEDCDDSDSQPAVKKAVKKVAHKTLSSSKKSAKPKATSSKHAATPKKTEPKAKPKAASSNGGEVTGGTKGISTFFTQDGTEGACGRGKVDDSAKVVAMCPSQFRGACGKQIQITSLISGKTITAVGNDECPECPCNHLDLSIGAWNALGVDQDVGVADIKFKVL